MCVGKAGMERMRTDEPIQLLSFGIKDPFCFLKLSIRSYECKFQYDPFPPKPNPRNCKIGKMLAKKVLHGFTPTKADKSPQTKRP
jgi:hypothetical protein